MKAITLSLNPTYLCNFRCNFCYLTKGQLADKRKLDLDVLKQRLQEIHLQGYHIDHVDLYGGEIGLLHDSYLEELDQILFEHSDPTINIISNLSIIKPYFLKDHIQLSVSYDFDARERSEKVLENMMVLGKDISILMLASRELLKKDITQMIQTFNTFSNIISVEIKPYSTNQANQFSVSDKEFEDFVIQWIENETPKRFEFINAELIKDSINLLNNAFSDDHIYLTPEGKFSVLEFDQNHHEYFLELDTFADYLIWATNEKKRVRENKFCQNCTYLGHCLTEHYRSVTSLDQSCNGYKGLLEYYSKSFSVNREGTL